MKYTLPLIVLVGNVLISTTPLAATATYQFCSTADQVASCRVGGSAVKTSNYAQTKYPLVFAHGDGGFSSAGPLQYWYGISEDLTANGANVFITQEASLNSSEIRGEQLLTQVQQILAMTGSQKVNLIGHSHGSHSVRYVAGLLPNKIASVTTVGGPAFGSPAADTVVNYLNTPVIGSFLGTGASAAINAFFSLVGATSGQVYDQNMLADLNSLTTTGAAKFNTKFPAALPSTPCGQGASLVNSVRYYSWGGTGIVTNLFDPTDLMFALTSTMVPGPNDGLVPQCSSHLGQVIRDNYPQNHLDLVNQMLGLVDVFSPSPIALYRQHANRLKVAGL